MKSRKNVEICRAGTFRLSSGQHTFTRAQLESAIRNAAAGSAPAIGIGHTDPRWVELAAGDGEPALGRVENLRLSDDGEVLLGDFEAMPDWFADALPTSFPRRSLEGPCKGDELTIDAVKVLGVKAPGVSTLKDLEQFVSEEGPALIAAGADNQGRDVRVVLASRETGAKPMDKKKLAQAFGLPANATDEQLKTAVNRWRAEHATKTPQERDRILASAVTDGKFGTARVPFWRERYDRDPAGTRKTIEGLAGGVSRGRVAASGPTQPDADSLHARTRRALRLDPPARTPVAAASGSPTAQAAKPGPAKALGPEVSSMARAAVPAGTPKTGLARNPDGEVVWGGAPTRLSDRGTRQIFHGTDFLDVEEAERSGITGEQSLLSIHSVQMVGSAAAKKRLNDGLSPTRHLLRGAGNIKSAGSVR